MCVGIYVCIVCVNVVQVVSVVYCVCECVYKRYVSGVICAVYICVCGVMMW